MRIWSLPCRRLCRAHLLGEHRELHAIHAFLTTSKGRAYRRHPETLRWRGHLSALSARHAEQVTEMARRGYSHASPLPALLRDAIAPPPDITPLAVQLDRLRAKGCDCNLAPL